MPTYQRPSKANGSNAYVAGFVIESAEVNADVDGIVTFVNGQLDDDNIAASAGIVATKLDHISDTEANARATASPGTSADPTEATDLGVEIRQLRDRITALMGGKADYLDSDDAAFTSAWQESPPRGANLIRNPSFSASVSYDLLNNHVPAPASTSAPPDGFLFVVNSLTAGAAQPAIINSPETTFGRVSSNTSSIADGDLITVTKASNPTQQRWILEKLTPGANDHFYLDEAFVGDVDSTWTLTSQTPISTLTIQSPPASEGTNRREVTVVANTNATQQGFGQIIDNPKPNQRFLVGAHLKQEVNAAHLKTLGGKPAGADYQDFDATTTTGSYEVVTGIVEADASGSPITISVLTDGAIADSFSCRGIFCYAMEEKQVAPELPILVRSDFAVDALMGTAASSSNLFLRNAGTTWEASVSAVAGSIAEISLRVTTQFVGGGSFVPFSVRIVETAPDGLERFVAHTVVTDFSAGQLFSWELNTRVHLDQTGTYTYTPQHSQTTTGTQTSGADYPGELTVKVI